MPKRPILGFSTLGLYRTPSSCPLQCWSWLLLNKILYSGWKNRLPTKPLTWISTAYFPIMFCIWFYFTSASFSDILNFSFSQSSTSTFCFPFSCYCQFLKRVIYTCATASTHLLFNPLHVWLLKPPRYANYSLNITTCLPKFNNLFSICVLLNLSNSLDFWSLSLFIISVLLVFSMSFFFSRAGTFLIS